ncbi:hypothetical protein ACQI5H_23090 [Mycobacterium heidelbergense]|uniref:hypothetical protein n=1 Tax=Mycobacterium heidelbergense TaxID=53376 RepID=UPI003CF406F9
MSIAEYLRSDLRRIVDTANNRLSSIQRAGLPASTRDEMQAQVIERARALAIRRVESTVRHLHGPVHRSYSENSQRATARVETQTPRRFKTRRYRRPGIDAWVIDTSRSNGQGRHRKGPNRSGGTDNGV